MAQHAGQVSPDGQWVWTGTQWLPKQPTPIPIQGAYGPPWARPYESARFRATIVSIFLGANAVGILMLMVFDGWASNISSRMTTSDTPSVVVAGAWISILSAIVLVGAAALAILVVREVTARQDRKSELITSGRLS